MDDKRLGILIVDDDELVVRATRRFLNAAYRVRTATDALNAMRECAIEVPNVVISDLDMLPVLTRIHREHPSVRRVIYSGSRSEFLGELVQTGVADAAASKPATLEQLKQAIEGYPTERPSRP